jgi:transposase
VIAFRADLKIWIAAQPVDFRKSIHTLSALVSEALKANPYGGDVFVLPVLGACDRRPPLGRSGAAGGGLRVRRRTRHRQDRPTIGRLLRLMLTSPLSG